MTWLDDACHYFWVKSRPDSLLLPAVIGIALVICFYLRNGLTEFLYLGFGPFIIHDNRIVYFHLLLISVPQRFSYEMKESIGSRKLVV